MAPRRPQETGSLTPSPITRTDELIHALIRRHDEQTRELQRISNQLQAIRKDLKGFAGAPLADAGGTAGITDLREPKKPSRKKR